MSPPLITFAAGASGAWRVDSVAPVIGEGLGFAPRLAVHDGHATDRAMDHADAGADGWSLRGVVSNGRYTTREEFDALAAAQEGLGRSKATHAALIPIRKNAAWWALTQDERRALMEEQSRHITIGLRYLPAVARRLHHSRDLGEPFDFLTWFEYAPADANAFETLVAELRATAEWGYVDREVDIRLSRDAEGPGA